MHITMQYVFIILLFYIQGHDTTTSAISWTLYMLAKHPEHQLKCYEEVSTVLSNRDSDHMEW